LIICYHFIFAYSNSSQRLSCSRLLFVSFEHFSILPSNSHLRLDFFKPTEGEGKANSNPQSKEKRKKKNKKHLHLCLYPYRNMSDNDLSNNHAIFGPLESMESNNEPALRDCPPPTHSQPMACHESESDVLPNMVFNLQGAGKFNAGTQSNSYKRKRKYHELSNNSDDDCYTPLNCDQKFNSNSIYSRTPTYEYAGIKTEQILDQDLVQLHDVKEFNSWIGAGLIQPRLKKIKQELDVVAGSAASNPPETVPPQPATPGPGPAPAPCDDVPPQPATQCIPASACMAEPSIACVPNSVYNSDPDPAVIPVPQSLSLSGKHKWLHAITQCLEDRETRLSVDGKRITHIIYYPKCTKKSPSPDSLIHHFDAAGVARIPMVLSKSRMHSNIKSFIHLDRFVLHFASGEELTINGKDGRAQVFACRRLNNNSLVLVSAMNVHNVVSSNIRRKFRSITVSLLPGPAASAAGHCTIRVFETTQADDGTTSDTTLENHCIVFDTSVHPLQ
jgi:hypothetical protein